MNCDNAQYMLAIFSTGFACGLEHRYECYRNYEDMLLRYSPYEQTQANIDEMWNIVLEFEKGLAGSPEEENDLYFYTVEDLEKNIEAWYASKRRNNFNQNVLY